MKKNFSVAIAGGGSTYTPDMLEMLCLVREDFPLRKVVLYDIDADRQEHIGKFGEILFREYYPEAEFSYTTDPQKAFEDIDFVLVQILLKHGYLIIPIRLRSWQRQLNGYFRMIIV